MATYAPSSSASISFSIASPGSVRPPDTPPDTPPQRLALAPPVILALSVPGHNDTVPAGIDLHQRDKKTRRRAMGFSRRRTPTNQAPDAISTVTTSPPPAPTAMADASPSSSTQELDQPLPGV